MRVRVYLYALALTNVVVSVLLLPIVIVDLQQAHRTPARAAHHTVAGIMLHAFQGERNHNQSHTDNLDHDHWPAGSVYEIDQCRASTNASRIRVSVDHCILRQDSAQFPFLVI